MARRVATLRQIASERIDALVADPSLVQDALEEDLGDDDPGLLDIDKSWHGIHFLLTGGVRGADAPPVDVIMGGKNVGTARVLAPDDVKVAAETFPPSRKLWARFDKALMTNLGIYPEFWEEKKDALDYLLFHYEKLVDYYKDAARRGRGMLIQVT